MLDLNALQQLKQLKADITVKKEVFKGRVRGTNGRFGFVDLDDTRQIFLPPDEMNKVFPHDIIEVSLEQDSKDKTFATVEKKISSQLKAFVGKVIKKGTTLFVEPDVDQLNRWIYLPPSETMNAEEGDFVECAIQRHPFPKGKAQCKITRILGNSATEGLSLKYVQSRFNLASVFSDEVLAQAEQLNQHALEELKAIPNSSRIDLRSLPFVTIDGESTLDMDDAVYCEAQDDGWLLRVAIADPASVIQPDSLLDLEAKSRGTSVYMPGSTLNMLPKVLSQDTFSLVEGQDRPALVCSLQVDSQGKVSQSSFASAWIKSAAKLSYPNVTAFYASTPDNSDTTSTISDNSLSLLALKACTDQLKQHRLANNLVMDERPDYHYELDEQQCIVNIHRQDRTSAHRVIEESMLATNQAGAQLLQEHNNVALYSTHSGFRAERLSDANKILLEQFPDHTITDIDQLPGFIAAMQLSETSELPLRATLSRLLGPAVLSLKPAPHMGMGMASYVTLTSPIRKYSDLLAHRAINSIINKQTDRLTAIDVTTTESMQLSMKNARRASQFIESWFNRDFMQGRKQETFAAQIVQVNSMGVRVRLDDTGIEGFVILKDHKPKLTFDPLYLRYYNSDQTFQLQQSITVQFNDIDEQKSQINFTLA